MATANAAPHLDVIKKSCMINQKDNPIEWSLLLYELDDCKEHLKTLIEKMNNYGHIDDSEFQIDIGHIYSHINRSWNSRNRVGEENFNLESKFPNDIKPI